MSELHFNYGAGGMTKNLNLIDFSEPFAGYKTKIFCNSQQTAVTLKINEVKCSGARVCEDMELWLDNCDLGDFSCQYPGDCPNCRIYVVGNVDNEGNPLWDPCYGY
eukprot:324251_1